MTRDAVVAAGLTASITYVGGGSGAGENALIAGTQRIAPMSRQLNNGVTDAVKCVGTAQQLLLGLDGLSIVLGNPTHGDSLEQTATTADDCSDTISARTLTGIVKADGVTPCDATDGCTTAGSYTFANWKEVLQMVYGGQNHNTATAAINAAAGAVCTYRPFTVCPAAPPIPANCAPGCVAGDRCLEGDDTPCAAGQVCFPNNRCGVPGVVGTRNPGRTSCMNPVRVALAANWGNIFQDLGTPNACRTPAASANLCTTNANCTAPATCINGVCQGATVGNACTTTADCTAPSTCVGGFCTPFNGCTRLRHALRRDDLSGTTDAFTALVGLPTTANPTRAFNLNSPQADRQAAASPFCNAGDRPINKGDSDYLNLDPIRRSVDHVRDAANNRFGREQVSEFHSPTFGGNNNDVGCNFAGTIPQDRASTTQPGIWPDPNIAGSTALLQADLGSNGAGGVLRTSSTRSCLGLVLPVTLPANYGTPQLAYFADASNNPVVCDIVAEDGISNAVASVIMDTQHSATALCPNGTPQPCLLPYKFDLAVPITHHNFNCISDQLNPNVVGGYADRRAFNLHPIDTAGHYVRDNYLNPVIPVTSLSATRQARVVSGYYRIHTTTATRMNGSIPTLAAGTGCRQFTSTDQIGCLAKANTCSLGFAGREAVDDILLLGTANNFASLIEGVRPTTINIQNLVNGSGGTVYPIARTLWLNSILGPPYTSPELDLFNFMSTPSSIDPIIVTRNFTPVPAAVTNRVKACPATFP